MPASCDFSVEMHSRFLDGYMDAVGRFLGTNEDAVHLSCTFVTPGDALPYGVEDEIVGRTRKGNWSAEFDGIIRNLLDAEPRTSPMFYLQEYIEWFQQFTVGASCDRLDWNPREPERKRQAAYLLEFVDRTRVLLLFSITDRETLAAHNSHEPASPPVLP
jgi:hypothetical protein